MTTGEIKAAIARDGLRLQREQYGSLRGGRPVSAHRWVIYSADGSRLLVVGTSPRQIFSLWRKTKQTAVMADLREFILVKKHAVASRCNALKQARQILVRTAELANRRSAPFRITPEQEAELQACAVIIRRVESSLWNQWKELDKDSDKDSAACK